MRKQIVGFLHNQDGLAVMEKFNDETIDMILTDPPYKRYRSNRSKAGRTVALIDNRDFDAIGFGYLAYRKLKAGAHLYCFSDHRAVPHIRTCLELAGLTYKSQLIWVKENHGSGDLKGDYAPQHEVILFFTKGKGLPLRGPRPSNVLYAKRVPIKRYGFSTVKPDQLLDTLILKGTERKQIVFDPYAGTGSTMISAVRLGRVGIACEINPKTYSIAVYRMRHEAKVVSEDGVTHDYESVALETGYPLLGYQIDPRILYLTNP